LLVQGKGKDGIPFSEHTTLENLSIRGAYFLLENDPAPDDLLDVEFLGRTNAPNGSPASKSFRPIKSQLIRKYPVELPDKTKNGIAVVFR